MAKDIFEGLSDVESLPKEWQKNNVLFQECPCGGGIMRDFSFDKKENFFVISCSKCGNKKKLWEPNGGIWLILSAEFNST